MKRTVPYSAFFLFVCFAAVSVYPQGIRERIRINNDGAKVSDKQATDLTLTLSNVEVRSIQQIVRTGGTIDKTHKVLTATIATSEGQWIQVGQRARTFPPESKQSMYQARVTRVAAKDGKTTVEATLAGQGIEGRVNYVLEITVERGNFLCVPSEAIIEEGDRRVVYIEQKGGSYAPRRIETGLQGELYTEIRGGVAEGDRVVTFGSFFIDSEYKLKFADGK